MEKKIDLVGLLNLYKLHIVWILIVSILTGVGGYVYSKVFVDPLYTSTAKMYINAQYDEDGRTSSNILTSSRRLLETYSAILLEGDDFLYELGQSLPVKMSVSQLRGAISLSSVSDTEIMKISVTTTDRNLSHEICKKFSDAAPALLYEVAQAGNVKVFSDPTKPMARSYPDNVKFATSGVMLGFFVYCALLFVFYIFDNSIKSADDVKDRLGMPVLGEVPAFNKGAMSKSKTVTANIKKSEGGE